MPDGEEDWSELITRENLKRELTLDSYAEEELNEASLSNESVADSRRRLRTFVNELRNRAQPGDTWWEWVQGTQPLRQQGGLALVRDGRIVWATMTWIS